MCLEVPPLLGKTRWFPPVVLANKIDLRVGKVPKIENLVEGTDFRGGPVPKTLRS